MNNLIRYSFLFVIMMSFASFGYAIEKKECPKGQVFDVKTSTCIPEPAAGTGTGLEAPKPAE